MSSPQTEVLSTRVPAPYVRSLRRIAELRRMSMSGVLAQLVVEQVAPSGDDVDALEAGGDQEPA